MYNVKHYGAVGDGITDDSNAIRAAIASLQNNTPFPGSQGGTIYFPPGVYLVGSTVDLSGLSSVVLLGDAPAAMGGWSASAIVYTAATGSLFTLHGCINVHFRNLGLEWSNALYNGTLLDFTPGSGTALTVNCGIIDCHITCKYNPSLNFYGYWATPSLLVDLDKTYGCSFVRTIFYGGQNAVRGKSGNSSFNNSAYFEECNFEYSNGPAILNPDQAWMFNCCTWEPTNTFGVSTVVMSSFGSGYTAAPTVGWSGALATTVTAQGTATINSVVSSIAVSNGGSGYSSAPTVTISGGGATTGATATAVLGSGGTAGQVVSITINNGGAGYTSAPAVTLGGGGFSVAATIGTVSINSQVTSVSVTNSGQGYWSGSPTVTFGAPGTGAVCSVAVAGGQVTGVTVTNGGSGFTSVPSVTFTAPPTPRTPTGTCQMTNSVTSINITNGGSGYTTPPTITFSGFTTNYQTPVATATVVGGVVTAVTITSGGSYLGSPNVVFSASPSGINATGTIASTTQVVNAVILSDNGFGYLTMPTVTFTGGGGSGAAGTCYSWGAAGAIVANYPVRGLNVKGCWIGDDLAPYSGTWISLAGAAGSALSGGSVGVNIQGNFIQCSGGTTGIKITGDNCYGINVVGNHFKGLDGTSKAIDFGSTAGHVGFNFSGNNFSTGSSTINTQISGTVPSGAVYETLGSMTIDSPIFTGTASFGNNAPNLMMAADADFETAATGNYVNVSGQASVSSYNPSGTSQSAKTGTMVGKVLCGNGGTNTSLTLGMTGNGGSGMIPATPGTAYYVQASFLLPTGQTARMPNIDMYAYSTPTTGGKGPRIAQGLNTVAESSSWLTLYQSAVFPTGYSYLGLFIRWNTVSGTLTTNEFHYLDAVSISNSPNRTWSPPAAATNALQVQGTHVYVPSGTPSITANTTGLGNTGTATISGSDQAGVITLTPNTATGNGAVATVTFSTPFASSVSSITVTNAGSGYSSVPTVAIAAPSSGVTAIATAFTSSNTISSIVLGGSGGSGYTSAPSVTITGVGSNGAATAVLTTEPRAIIITPANSSASALSGNSAIYEDVASRTNSSFVLSVGATLANGTYKFNYQVLG